MIVWIYLSEVYKSLDYKRYVEYDKYSSEFKSMIIELYKTSHSVKELCCGYGVCKVTIKSSDYLAIEQMNKTRIICISKINWDI